MLSDTLKPPLLLLLRIVMALVMWSASGVLTANERGRLDPCSGRVHSLVTTEDDGSCCPVAGLSVMDDTIAAWWSSLDHHQSA